MANEVRVYTHAYSAWMIALCEFPFGIVYESFPIPIGNLSYTNRVQYSTCTVLQPLKASQSEVIGFTLSWRKTLRPSFQASDCIVALLFKTAPKDDRRTRQRRTYHRYHRSGWFLSSRVSAGKRLHGELIRCSQDDQIVGNCD